MCASDSTVIQISSAGTPVFLHGWLEKVEKRQVGLHHQHLLSTQYCT